MRLLIVKTMFAGPAAIMVSGGIPEIGAVSSGPSKIIGTVFGDGAKEPVGASLDAPVEAVAFEVKPEAEESNFACTSGVTYFAAASRWSRIASALRSS